MGAIFALGVALFSLAQIVRGLTTGRIFSISSWTPTRDRKLHPFGFWVSFGYYVIWIAVTVFFGLTYLLGGTQSIAPI